MYVGFSNNQIPPFKCETPNLPLKNHNTFLNEQKSRQYEFLYLIPCPGLKEHLRDFDSYQVFKFSIESFD